MKCSDESGSEIQFFLQKPNRKIVFFNPHPLSPHQITSPWFHFLPVGNIAFPDIERKSSSLFSGWETHDLLFPVSGIRPGHRLIPAI